MSKKIRLILLILSILIVGIVTVCHSFYISHREEKGKIFRSEESTEKTIGNITEDTAENTLEDLTEEASEVAQKEEMKELPKEVTACQNMVVSIHCECGGGNAVLLCEKEDSYLFCTAAHVVSGLENSLIEELQIEIGGQQVFINYLWTSDTYDVAFFEVAKELKESVKEAGFSEDGYTNLKEKDTLFVWSHYHGELTNLQIKVNNPWIFIEDFGYHMIWASAVNAKGGMSGSGVFDCRGHLAGILCGGNETEVVVLPMNLIMGELKNSGIDISLD